MFDSSHGRRRRRRRIIWPLLVTVAVVIGVIVATAGSDARSTIAYTEDLRTSSEDVGRAGTALQDLVADLSRVDRAEFQSVVDGVESALAAAAEVAAMEAPEDSLIGATALFRLAIDSWRQGIGGFSNALLAAADDPANTEAEDELASAVVLVRTGDRIYDALVDELNRDDVPNPVAPMPEVRLLPVDAPVTVLAPAWITAARSEVSGLPLRSSVRIEQVASDPEWVTNADGAVVLRATAAVDLTVIVGNSGNTDSGEGTVGITLASSDGSEPVELDEEVPNIAAGAQTSVIFRDVTVTPGSSYTLEVRLAPGGTDIFLDDNQLSMGFVVNAATEG